MRVIPRRSPIATPIPVVGGASQVFGLDYRDFPNGVAGSDIRLVWSGADKPSDTSRTVLCKSLWGQQTGYYAWGWLRTYDQADFEFDGIYELGFHPYPTPALASIHIDANGQVLYDYGTIAEQTNHCFEIAGLGGHDYLATAGSTTPIQLTTGVWMYSVMRISLISSGTVIRHEYIPDLVNNPTVKIVQDIPLSTLDNGTSGNPKLMVLGASPWRSSDYSSTGTGTTNDETPCSVQRQIIIVNAALSDADCLLELAAEGTAGLVTATGQANAWYKKRSPTPSDITDESGAGHTPSWGNANRPTLWTGAMA